MEKAPDFANGIFETLKRDRDYKNHGCIFRPALVGALNSELPWEKMSREDMRSVADQIYASVTEITAGIGAQANVEAAIVGQSRDYVREDAVRRLIARARKRGELTYDELNEALPQDKMTYEQIEDVMSEISEMGVNIVEGEAEYAGWEEAVALPKDKAISREEIEFILLAKFDSCRDRSNLIASLRSLADADALRSYQGIDREIDGVLIANAAADSDLLLGAIRAWHGYYSEPVLAHPKVDGRPLAIMASSGDQKDRERVAAHPVASPETLLNLFPEFPDIVLANPAFAVLKALGPALLARLGRKRALFELFYRKPGVPPEIFAWGLMLAGDPAAPESALETLARCEVEDIEKRVAGNEAASAATLMSLLPRYPAVVDGNPAFMALHAQHPQLLEDVVGDEWRAPDLQVLLEHSDCPAWARDWASNIASDDRSPPSLLVALSKVCTDELREMLAGNPGAPGDVLLALIGQYPDTVAANPAFEWLLLENPKLLAEIDEKIAASMIASPRCPSVLIDRVVREGGKAAQLAVLRRHDLTRDHAELLSRSRYPRVAENAQSALVRLMGR